MAADPVRRFTGLLALFGRRATQTILVGLREENTASAAPEQPVSLEPAAYEVGW